MDLEGMAAKVASRLSADVEGGVSPIYFYLVEEAFKSGSEALRPLDGEAPVLDEESNTVTVNGHVFDWAAEDRDGSVQILQVWTRGKPLEGEAFYFIGPGAEEVARAHLVEAIS